MNTVADKSVGALESIVYVVDDDVETRESLSALFRSVGFNVELFDSVPKLLAYRMPATPGCLVLDVRLKGESGLVAHNRIARQTGLPIIFMTAHADVEMCVQAMKGGAVDFIEKPFRGQRMLDAVTTALASDRQRRELDQSFEALRCCYESLTRRERDVMSLVAKGRLNKQIAAEMNLSEMTIKIHRMRAMKKMKADSFADFVLKAATLLKFDAIKGAAV
ncbi:response regulator transcription factor [Paraburkholderia humisilvae]|nr:response regulator [Paraburkholderia humisilvae]